MNITATKHRIFGLDLMRTVAITAVVLGHLPVLESFSAGSLFTELLKLSAFWGVEIFFVLSGFLIGRILINTALHSGFGKLQLFNFLKRRWMRTLPNYFLVLLINILLGLVIGFDLSGAWRYFVFSQNLWQNQIGFFTESWSLSVEEWTYLLLALSIWGVFVFKGKRLKHRLLGCLVFLWVLFVASKAYYFFYNPEQDWNLALKSVVIYRIDAIITGVLFAWGSVFLPDFFRKSKAFLLMVGLLLLLFLSMGLGLAGLDNRASFFWTVVYLPLTSLAFACFLPTLFYWKTNLGYVSVPVTFISKISYALYLLHYSIVLYLFNLQGFAQGLLSPLLYVMVTLVLSVLLYRFFEKPIMDLRDK